jgi:hypothetical protein
VITRIGVAGLVLILFCIICISGCGNIKVESKGPLSNILTSSQEENSKNKNEYERCILPRITNLQYSTLDLRLPVEMYSEGGAQWVKDTTNQLVKEVLNGQFDTSSPKKENDEYFLRIFFELKHGNFQHNYLTSKTKKEVQIDQYEVDIGTKVTYEFLHGKGNTLILNGTSEGFAKNTEKQTAWEQFAVSGGKDVFRRCFETTMRESLNIAVANIVKSLSQNGKCQ